MNVPAPSFLDRIASAATGLAAMGLGGMVAVQAWQVLARYVLNDSPAWTEPLTLVLLSTTLSFGAAAGVHARSHFRFPLLVALLPVPAQHAFARLASTIVGGIGALMALGGATLFLDGLPVRLAGTVLPQGTVFLPLAIGGLLILAFSLAQLRHPVSETL